MSNFLEYCWELGRRMDLITRDLLINFLFILIPLFLLQMFYLSKYTYRFEELKGWMYAIFPIISIILCMLFPVALVDPFILDLRRIPFILGALYGGWRLGFALLAFILVTRAFIGDGGFYVTSFVFAVTAVCACMLSSRYLKMSLKQRMAASGFLVFLSLIVSWFCSTYILGIDLGSGVWAQYIVINVIGMLIATLLWEVIRTNFEVLQKVIKAEKLTVVSHLAASISHEVRNPLTVSRGFVQMLGDDEIGTQTRKQYADIALQELDRAAAIINDYLMFANPVPEKEEDINVCEEIERTANVLTPLANMNGVEIRLALLTDQNYYVMGERKKFQQCLINILKNAIEAMPNTGKLKISLSDYVEQIQIDIVDEGKGMTREQIDRLGEPYFTTKEKGTGLGMMVSFSIIKGMNGRVYVKSEPGKGSCFSIRLPFHHDQEVQDGTANSTKGSSSNHP
jgi:two-component system sporulation sensor kinase B